MTRSRHAVFVFFIIICLVLEVIPLQWFSAISGVAATGICIAYSYQLAKNHHWAGYLMVMIALIFSVFYLSRPVIHYAHNQYDSATGKFTGNPHYHPIWEFDHVH